MSRKQQSSLVVWIEVIALFPWWAGQLLAVVSYLWLHHIATAPLGALPPGQIGAAVTQGFFASLAMIGQYIVPFVCVAGALVSAFARRKRAMLFENASSRDAVAAINTMSWREFEMLVGEAFRRGGYAVVETGGGADGGVDIVLRKDGEKYLVQCKQWRANKVGVQVIRELYGVMAASGAAGGFVVTSGVFTHEAKKFADGRNIELVDGTELHEIIKQVHFDNAKDEKTQATTGPLCPKCGSLMIMRTAKQGSKAGSDFWGCSQFPKCRGSVSTD